MSQSLTDRYDDRLAGVLSCYDRVLITGTLPGVCYAAGMTRYLNARGIRIFDYPEFAKPLRDRVRDRAATLAAEAGLTIEHVGKSNIRKEDVVARVLKQRGDHPGLVHIISAMEACDAYQPWHDKNTHKTFIRPDSGKCLHYYFYFLDAWFGLIYLRVPPHPGSLCRTVLPSVRRFRANLPLEPDAGGIRHRSGVPLHRHPRSTL
jgi:hypothetical protein